MAETRPTGDQLRLQSSRTGEHIIDAYLENSEIGNRTLADLLSDVFETDGNLRQDLFEVRYSGGYLQVRYGYVVNPAAVWQNITSVFQNIGAYNTGVAYKKTDVVGHDNGVYICTTDHTSVTSSPDPATFFLAIDPAYLNQKADEAAASATAAASSASTATTQANNAASSASTATTQANNAATSASTATTQANTATTQANNAAASASTATTQANTATTKASEAQTSATDANNAKLAAEAAYDAFDDRWLGVKSSDPTLDNDGNALVTGTVYFNNTLGWRFWNGTAWGPITSAAWGFITGTLSSQTDLQTALDGKANTSHTHSIANVTGLQTALDGKSATGHTHTLANVTDVTITAANLNLLDDGADTTLHFHAADRARANHTGTQLASTISDFASAVSAQVSPSYQPLDADLTAIGAIAGTSGLLRKTAANTWSLETSAYLTANQTITLSGDVTGSGTTSIVTALAANSADSTAIAANAVNNTKLADMATQTVKGRNTASTGDPEDISMATLKVMLSLGTAAYEDHGTTANSLVRLNASAQIPAVSGALLTSLNGANITNSTITAAKLNGAQTGSAPALAARAWCRFVGTGTVSLSDDGNVTSITDSGVGNYVINLTTAMDATTYSVAGFARWSDNTAYSCCIVSAKLSDTRSTTQFEIRTVNTVSGGDMDSPDVNVIFVG